MAAFKQFEMLVADIYRAMLELEGVDNVVVEHNRLVQGSSGQSHQVDVYWEFTIGRQTYRTCIECKLHGRPIGHDAVIKMKYIIDDLGPGTTGVVASSSGFQSGATRAGTASGIQLVDISPLIRRVTIDLILGAGRVVTRIEPKVNQADANRLLSESNQESIAIEVAGTTSTKLFWRFETETAVGFGEIVDYEKITEDRQFIALTGVGVRTDVGPVILEGITVYSSVEEPMTERIVVAPPEAARALVKDVLNGHELTVLADGSVTEWRGAGE